MLSTIKHYCIIVITVLSVSAVSAQKETSKWKALIAIGVNSPSKSGFVTPYEAKIVNFPTINVGVQHMFKRQLGAKLDLGYNRFSNAKGELDFKTNYTRINAQVVYDPTKYFTFLPIGFATVFHAGPGFSMIKPLSGLGANKTSFFNVMAGMEVHYKINSGVSAFVDTSYIVGFKGPFDPVSKGYGSFNGNLINLSFGVSISLSGCYNCAND